ncbi:MAG: carbohydrate ABC transporter permease [Chloroflexi bacterium]|nr:carbohydrate ABC transporter permease [Chloroflexota bacterium]MCL5111110.1 carbohydrate ABC transporter permease [Chloroflexota bacterium]
MLIAVILLLVGIAMFPFLWIVQMSLKTQLEAFTMPPKLIFLPTFENYVSLLQDNSFLHTFANSTLASTITVVLSMVIGVPAAYVLSRSQTKADSSIALWVLTTRMAPPIAFAIPFFLIFQKIGLIDTIQGLVLVYLTFNLSLVMWMMRTFFDGLPLSLEEAAWIDGANIPQTFLRIALPLSVPGLATTAIFCFLLAWNDFFFALILTRSATMTAPVGIVNFMNYEGWAWGKITAGSVLIMLPVVAFSLLVRKYLIRGLTAGAIKG